jgi:Na+/H+-dicarboxylate symporter
LIVPVVVVSLVCGTAALNDIRRLGRLGLKTVLLYLTTTAVAISLALMAAIAMGPGHGFELEPGEAVEIEEAPPLTEVAVELFPRNIVEAAAEGRILQVIVFSILFGMAMTLAGAAGSRVLLFFQDLMEIVMKLVTIVIWLAPIGVFALIARIFATEGFEAFPPLAGYFLVVTLVLLIHGLVVYPLLLKLLGGLNPLKFLQSIWPAQIFAFSTASSAATIPITLRAVRNRMGVDNSVASFTVPFGATVNMDGTAIMQGVATVFIAQAYGLSLGVPEYLLVVLTATLASIGTAAVPGAGLIMLAMVLNQVGLPVEGIALIIGVDRLLDMLRTAINITGDATVTCVVAASEGSLNREIFNSDDPDR